MKRYGRIRVTLTKPIRGKSVDTFSVVVMERELKEVVKAYKSRGYSVFL